MPEILGRQGDAVVVQQDDGSIILVPGVLAQRFGVMSDQLSDFQVPGVGDGIPEQLGLPGAAEARVGIGAPPQSAPAFSPSPGIAPTLGAPGLAPSSFTPPPTAEPTPQAAPTPLLRHQPRTGMRDIDAALAESSGLQQAGVLQQTQALEQSQEAARAMDPAFQRAEAAIELEATAVAEAERQRAEAFTQAQSEIGEANSEMEKLAASDPDPSRWWSSKNDFSKVATLVGLVFHSFASPESGRAAVQGIKDEIDKDVLRQETAINRRLAALRERKAGIGQSLDWETEKIRALSAAQTAKVTSAVKLLDLAKTRATSDQQIAALEQAKGQLLTHLGTEQQGAAFQAAGLRLQRAQIAAQAVARRGAQEGPLTNAIYDPNTGQPIVINGKMLTARDEESSKKANESLAGYRDYMMRLEAVTRLREKLGGSLEAFGAKFGVKSDEYSQFESEMEKMAADFVRLTQGERSTSDTDIKNARKHLGGTPSLLGMSRKGLNERLRSMATKSLQGSLGSKGVDVSFFDPVSILPKVQGASKETLGFLDTAHPSIGGIVNRIVAGLPREVAARFEDRAKALAVDLDQATRSEDKMKLVKTLQALRSLDEEAKSYKAQVVRPPLLPPVGP